MTVPVSIEKKRAFLHWFIMHHKVEAHDMDWFLKDLMDNEQALEHVHFIDDITDCPKGIIITSHLNEQISFQFFKGNVRTDDVYTAYHEMNLYQEESIFIQINFPFCSQNSLYQAVIEDDVYAKTNIKFTTEKLLNHTLKQGRREFIMKEINIALDKRDQKQFIYYTSLLLDLDQ